MSSFDDALNAVYRKYIMPNSDSGDNNVAIDTEILQNFVIQQMEGSKEMWAVIFRNKEHRDVKRFGNNRAEADRFLEHFLQLVGNKKIKHLRVGVVNMKTPTPPPENFAVQGKKWWCPYCACTREFRDDVTGYVRCELCGISEGDFYVKKFNKLGW